MRKHNIIARLSGFTLIELMVTLLVLGILVSIAVPSMRDTIIKNRVVSEVNLLVAALNAARSESIKRGRSVSLLKSGNWQDGWTMFEDSGVYGSIDGSDAVIKVSNGFGSSTDTLTFSRDFIRFTSTGFADLAGIFLLCTSDKDTGYARAIYISSTGRVRLSSDTNGNGIHDDGDASTPTELSCP